VLAARRPTSSCRSCRCSTPAPGACRSRLPAAGSKLVLPGRQTDGASLARLIAAEGVTIAVGVPTVFLGLCEHLDATGTKLPSLERIILGGAPMPPALMERI
jgi:acyl-CoA synthetase (AMP-forming)/AMP-acid ligase II